MTARRLRGRSSFVLACALAWLTTGCGEKSSIRIAGNVSMDGEPVSEGSISFEPLDGQGTVTGGPITNGQYSVEGDSGFNPGEKRVRIVGVRKTGRRLPDPEAKGEYNDEVVMYIPRQFNTESQLKVNLAVGDNSHDFQLKGD